MAGNSLMEQARRSSGLAPIRIANPVSPGLLPPTAAPGGSVQATTGGKVIEAALSPTVNNPALEPTERLISVMPNDAWYDPARSPTNPTQFEILHYEVPKGQAIIILDFSFEPYKFSGTGAFASEPFGRNQLTGILGYSFTINGRVPGTVDFGLEPSPSNFQRAAYRPDKTQLVPPQNRVAADFARTAAASYGNASGYGTGILPQRVGPFGSPVGQKAFIAFEQQHIVMAGIIYRQVPVPIRGIEAKFSGYTGSHPLIKKLVEDLKLAQ